MRKQNAVHNAAWIIACKLLQSLLQLLVGMLSARYLGPSGYGLLSYAAALTAFGIPLMQLGLNAMLVQEYVRAPEEEGSIRGTALALSGLSALLCMAGISLFAAIAHRGDADVIWVCVLSCIGLLFQSFENLQYCFQAKLLSKYSSLSALLGYLLVSGYKIYLLATGKSIRWFALTHAVEYGSAGIFMLLACRKLRFRRAVWSFPVARRLLATGRHYIPTALFIAAIDSIPGILLKLLSTQQEAGFYAAALTGSIVLQFVYAAVMDSLRPGILALRNNNITQYRQRISSLFGGFFYISLVQCVVFTLCSPWIIRLLYGAAYMPAAAVLRLIIWQTPFSLMGWVRDLWLLSEEKHPLSWRLHLFGALTNLILNLYLIPRWGACGAAITAVITQLAGNLITCYTFPGMKPIRPLLLAGLRPGQLIFFIKELKQYGKT